MIYIFYISCVEEEFYLKWASFKMFLRFPSTRNRQAKLRFQGVWVNSEAKAGYARHRAKEISTRLIRTWWYLRRLPGCNRDHVHTRCNRVCPAPLRFLRANRPWHSPIPWVEQLQLVQPRFTNDRYICSAPFRNNCHTTFPDPFSPCQSLENATPFCHR